MNCEWSTNREIGNSVVTIGSFDGVHRGHQSLLRQVRHIADERGLRAMAVTFATSPKRVLGAVEGPQLSTTEERTTLLRQSGMDEVTLLDFTPQMAAMTARDFMQQILKEQLQVEVLVIGYDHRFGRGRAEGFDDYVRYGQEIGMEVVRGEACLADEEPISSTRIRHLLTEGRVAEANRLLGHPYWLQGQVVGGYQEGRKMGFPTANIELSDASKLLPADGVYAVYVYGRQTTDDRQQTNLLDGNNCQLSRLRISESKGRLQTLPSVATSTELIVNCQFRYRGMLNIGHRPTLNNGRGRSIEVHILDFEGDLYGQSLQIEFVERLREEQTFANIEALTAQLQKDKEQVKYLLAKIK